MRLVRPYGRRSPFCIGWVAVRDRAPGGAVAVGVPFAVVGAAAGTSEADVRTRALGELVERHSGLERLHRGIGSSVEVGSVRQVRRAGAMVVCPDHYRHDAGPPSPGQAEPEFTWRHGHLLLTGAPAVIPVGARDAGGSGYSFPLDSSGVAAHLSDEAAMLAGLLEVVERDALMLSWRIPGWPVRRLQSPVPAEYQEVLAGLGLEARLYLLGSDELPRTVLALVHRAGGGLTCGSACRIDERHAVGVALGEALLLRWTAASSRPAWRLPAAERDQPCSSLGHLMHGYHAGAAVLEWYAQQADGWAAATASPASTSNLRAVAASAESLFGEPVVVLPAKGRRAQRAGWSVWRVVVGPAVRKESGAMPSRPTPRLEAELRRWALPGASLRKEVHPFA